MVDFGNNGSDSFYTTIGMHEQEFPDCLRMKGDACQKPERSDIKKNNDYRAFVEKYGLSLNKQKDRVVQVMEVRWVFMTL